MRDTLLINKSKEMYKRCFKIFISIVVVWGTVLFAMSKEFKKSNLLLSDEQLYEKALQPFIKVKGVKTNIFNDWKLLGASEPHTSYKDKLLAIKNNERPLGVLGKAVHMKDDIKGTMRMLIKKGWEDNAFNQFVSDLIPIDRSLPDLRNEWCLKRNSTANLPTVSVVICFHNEAWSTLLRTVHSVLNRTPQYLLQKIILVDDYSDMPHLKIQLQEYLEKFLKVTLIRTKKREGLIRARIIGVKEAATPVVVFLDSHCECTEGWIEPLLDRIAKNPKIVASPVIDHIDADTFEYKSQDPRDLQIGGFNWKLKFIWRSLPKEINLIRQNIFAPIKTPTIAGGLFAIDRKFFTDIGYYDEDFNTWGGENLELSFKVWMCGGSLEIVPCSHVGHIFRDNFPYKVTEGSVRRNLVRLAEVWLDEYAKYYYQRIGNVKGDFGDVSKRKQLREKLKCKSFDWYLNKIYPEMHSVSNSSAASGQIFSIGSYAVCLSGNTSPQDMVGTVKLVPCHNRGDDQFWVYTKDGKLQFDHLCLDYLFEVVSLFICRDKPPKQIWLYDTKTKYIRHLDTQDCLKVARDKFGLRVILERCMGDSSQKWVMENFDRKKLSLQLQNYYNKHV